MFRTIIPLASLALTLTLALPSSGCGKQQDQRAPSCEQAVDHVNKLLDRQATAEERKADIAACEKEPPAMRTCALKATTLAQLAACE